VAVDQIALPEFTDFHVQNEEQVRLFNADCSPPAATFTSTINGYVEVIIHDAQPDNRYVLSIKYETSTVVGKPEPGSVHYDFITLFNNVEIDRDRDGLMLNPK
jgi:hypothetical protein